MVAGAASYIVRRYIQVSFSLPEASQSLSDSEQRNHQSAVASDEEFVDSATREFLFAEDYVVNSLVGLRAREWNRAPQMQMSLVRRRNRAYLTGISHSFGRSACLAAVSQSWLRAMISEIAGYWCLIFEDLEEVSRANNFPYRVLHNTDDEYVARYTGRVCSSLQWGRGIHPVALRF